ncbi:MAG: hypothetical protein ACRDFR_01880 [Candidatus Limnocylindria bacterium]
MAEGSVECANCGNANPAWAQVCRSCGANLSAAASGAAGAANGRAEPFVTEGSLMAIGAAVGTILLAVVIGLVIGGILPPAPPVAAASPTPDASASAEPTEEPTPDLSSSPNPSASEAAVLPGTLSFGLDLNVETQRVINPSDTFTPGTTFAHSIELTSPFGVTQIAEQVARLNKDGSETVVITAEENPLPVDANATVDGFTVPTNALLDALGAGTYVMRVFRGSELLAQGTFILVE